MPTHKVLPGIDALGCGFNPFENTNGSYKPRLITLDYTGDDRPYSDAWSAGTYTAPGNRDYSVPKGIVIDPSGSEGALDKDVSESQSEVETKLAASASVSGGFGLFRASFAANYDVDQKQVNSSSYASARMSEKKWGLSLAQNLIDTRPELDKGFVTAVSGLPKGCTSTADRQAWDKFFGNFGTHFIRGCVVGGFSELFVSVTRSETMTQSKIAAQLELQYGSYFKGGGSAERDKMDKDYREASRARTRLYGGDAGMVALMETDPGAYARWVATIADNPAVRDFGLREIWTLIKDPALQAAAKAAFADYCYRNSDYSVRLNGAGSFVDITGQSGLSHLGDATFEAWVHPVGTGTATNGGILFNKDQSFEIARYPNGEIKFAFAIEGTKGWVWTATGRSIPANHWSHVAVSRSEKTGAVKVFINGQPLFSQTGKAGALADPGFKLQLGGRPAITQFFDGYLQEARVWARALDGAAIQGAMYNRLEGNEPGLVGLWTLNDATGDDAADRGSGRNPGKLRNGASWAVPPVASPVTLHVHSGGLETAAIRAALAARAPGDH